MSEQITEQTTENCRIMTIYKKCIKNLSTTVTGYFYKFKKEFDFQKSWYPCKFKYQNTDLLEKM